MKRPPPVKIACVGEGVHEETTTCEDRMSCLGEGVHEEIETSQVENENSGASSSNIDLLFGPDREVGKEFHKSVKRYQSCERSFTDMIPI